MKRRVTPFAILFILFIMLAACGPATPAPTPTPVGLVNSNKLPVPNVIVTVVPPALALPCTPPVPVVSDISSFCANPVKGLGGASYSDSTFYGNNETWSSWMSGDSIAPNVSCTLDQNAGVGTCSGPQNATFQAEVCGICGSISGIPAPPTGAGVACSQGYAPGQNGNCYPIGTKTAYSFCPDGSHYDNALQNCADNVTNKLASPCPAGFGGSYSPEFHKCFAQSSTYPEAYNCQTFPVKLGSCPVGNKAVINVVSFCQSSSGKKGGANITVPAGSTLSVDIKANRLDGCTAGPVHPDGTELYTCLGTAGMSFSVKLCTDPATCTSYPASLGACSVKREKPGAPAPPTCVHC